MSQVPTQNGGPAAPRLQQGMDARLARLEQWLKAVMHHEPGAIDDAADRVSAWSNSELRSLWIDTSVLVQLIRDPKASSFTLHPDGQRNAQPILYTSPQLRRVRALACAAGGQTAGGVLEEPPCADIHAANELDEELLGLARQAGAAKRVGDDNYILRRGALLHADVAMLLPIASEPIVGSGLLAPQRLKMSLSDGLGMNVRQVAIHWDLARMLLDNVKPRGSDRIAPGRDDMVRDWYRATAAWMQQVEDYDTLHLDRARAIFPLDPVILFLSGTQAEIYAAPHIQSAIRSAVTPPALSFAIGSDRAQWRQAETFFRRALANDAAPPEWHLHLGHVLLMLERHAEAAKELHEALASEDDEVLKYYGELFLGAAEEAIGHADAAFESYTAAARLFSDAQSPHVALSALARRRGDKATALREMELVFEAQAESATDDPWWSFYTSHARDADQMLIALRRPFLAEVVP